LGLVEQEETEIHGFKHLLQGRFEPVTTLHTLIPPFQGEHSLILLKAAPLQALQEEIRFPHSFFSTLEAHLAKGTTFGGTTFGLKSKRCSLELGGAYLTESVTYSYPGKAFDDSDYLLQCVLPSLW
jgi:hypothetical protein